MKNNSQTILGIVVIVVLAIAAFVYLNKPDHRNGFEKAGDAISELPNGPDKAARQLEDRTPGDKIKDAAHDATH